MPCWVNKLLMSYSCPLHTKNIAVATASCFVSVTASAYDSSIPGAHHTPRSTVTAPWWEFAKIRAINAWECATTSVRAIPATTTYKNRLPIFTSILSRINQYAQNLATSFGTCFSVAPLTNSLVTSWPILASGPIMRVTHPVKSSSNTQFHLKIASDSSCLLFVSIILLRFTYDCVNGIALSSVLVVEHKSDSTVDSRTEEALARISPQSCFQLHPMYRM